MPTHESTGGATPDPTSAMQHREASFTPSFGRFLWSESKAALAAGFVAVGTAAAFGDGAMVLGLYAFGALTVMGVLVRSLVFRGLCGITIGPSWVKGPCKNPAYGTTVHFGDLDAASSGASGPVVWIRSLTDESIRASASWFDDEQWAEMERLLRERLPEGREPIRLR